MELTDRVAVITGGSGGIGQAMARAFLAAGARTVVLADLDETAVNDAAKDIGCEGMPCNVTDSATGCTARTARQWLFSCKT